MKWAQRNMRHLSCDVAQQILGLDNINTRSACQSQGFLLSTFFIFYSSPTIYKDSSRLHASHFRVIPTLTLEDGGLCRRWQEDVASPIVFPDAPCGASFKMHRWPVSSVAAASYGWRPLRWLRKWKWKKGGDGGYERNNERFMTGIESRRWFYQAIINQIAPTEM